MDLSTMLSKMAISKLRLDMFGEVIGVGLVTLQPFLLLKRALELSISNRKVFTSTPSIRSVLVRKKIIHCAHIALFLGGAIALSMI
jgi:hypothetical protein